MEANKGSIRIDGVDISSISINQARGSLNALSQEPCLWPGSIRDNLVTAVSASEPEERLQRALQRVGLWSKVLGLGGLDALLDPEESFSHGERQLFCLARAMLNPSRILILDEFTSKYAHIYPSYLPLRPVLFTTNVSSVDVDTDRAMQKIIREDFKDRTILAVAHRLESIVDFDRIVVLDQGRVVEQGPPATLLSQGKSAFRALYEAQG